MSISLVKVSRFESTILPNKEEAMEKLYLVKNTFNGIPDTSTPSNEVRFANSSAVPDSDHNDLDKLISTPKLIIRR